MSEQNESTQEKKGGWKQWTKAEARQALAEWRKSGLPLGTFARGRGIGAERLRWWRKRLSQTVPVKRKKTAEAVRLVPAMIDGPLADVGPEAMVKLLVWTRGGFTIVHKRLERGTFTFPRQVQPGASSVELDADELAMLLEGIDVSRARRSPRWEPLPRARVA